MTSMTTSKTGGEFSIPEFPVQLGFSALLSLMIVTTYVLARRQGATRF